MFTHKVPATPAGLERAVYPFPQLSHPLGKGPLGRRAIGAPDPVTQFPPRGTWQQLRPLTQQQQMPASWAMQDERDAGPSLAVHEVVSVPAAAGNVAAAVAGSVAAAVVAGDSI